MPSKNSLKVTIGKESVAGTAVSTTAVVPIKDMPGIDRTISKSSDPAIVGAGMLTGEYATSADVKGSLPITPRSCAGFGQLLKGALGAETVIANVVGVIRMRYTGASPSCKLVAAATTLKPYIGTLGSEALDTTFGTSGTYTITPGTTTIATLLSAIAGVTNYASALVFGSPSSTIQSINAITASQGKGKWITLFLIGSSTGVYAHQFTPDLAIANERPTFSVQTDGLQDNIKWAGLTVGKLSLSAALKGAVEGTVDMLGFTEAIGQVASGLLLNDSRPFIFSGGVSSIGGTDYSYVRSNSCDIDNAPKDDGYSQASLDRSYHAKGLFSVGGSMKLRLDSTSYAERAKVESGVVASELIIYKAGENKCVGTSAVNEGLIIEVPYAEHSNFKFDGSDQVDCSLDWKGYNPGGAYNYDGPLTVTMLSSDASAY